MERNYDQESRDHPEHRYAYDFDYRMHGYMLGTFEGHLASGNALELGCFHGHFTKLLRNRFESLTVVEASEECIQEARRNVPADVVFHHSRFEEFRPVTTYSNIFLIHTLEHLDFPSLVLRRIQGWLAPGGRLFVATPNARAGSRQIAVFMGLISHNAAVTPAETTHGHKMTYSLDTLEAQIRECDLAVRNRGGVFFKGLANFQLDAALKAGIISDQYMDACVRLGTIYPDLCSSIYCVCERAD